MRNTLSIIDKFLVEAMRTRGVPLLRIALALVFLWFGALKVFGLSPVVGLVGETYPFFPQQAFIIILGIWEIGIGLGLFFKFALRFTLALLWLQMAGTLLAPLMSPDIFFTGGIPFLLTLEGEFVVKNIVLIVAGIVIGGHEVKPRHSAREESLSR